MLQQSFRAPLRRAVQTCTCWGIHPRFYTATSITLSGHSRWSTIKHDKAKADDAKTRIRTSTTKEIAIASRGELATVQIQLQLTSIPELGPDPGTNRRLATIIAGAKKAGIPKASIEAAIARGQGISASGAPLENITIEFMIPDSIAAVVECKTESKLKTMQDVREVVKWFGGSVTPTAYMFDRRGKLVFDNDGKTSDDQLLEHAIEAGALDMQVEDGKTIIYTEPSEITTVGQALTSALGASAESQDLVWEPREESKVEVDSDIMAENLSKLVARLEDDNSVHAVYLNTV